MWHRNPSILWENPYEFVPDPDAPLAENVARGMRASLVAVIAIIGFTGDARWAWLLVLVAVTTAWAFPGDVSREGFGDGEDKASCRRNAVSGDPTGNVVYGKNECPADGDDVARAAAESGELDRALEKTGFVAPNTDMLNRRLNQRQFHAKPDALPGRDSFVDMMFKEALAGTTLKEKGVAMRANYAGYGDEGYDGEVPYPEAEQGDGAPLDGLPVA